MNYVDPSGHICTDPEDAENGVSSSKCDKSDEPRGGGVSSNRVVRECGYNGMQDCPPDPSYRDRVFHEEFQMFLTTDPYYYGEAANETYTGFNGSGDSGGVNPGDRIGLINDFLIGYYPSFARNNNPYDQDVYLQYVTTYQNAPRVNATPVVSLISLQIRNSSKNIDSLVNYSVNITSLNIPLSVNSKGSAAPGQAASIPLVSGLDISDRIGGLNISINATTLCAGPCISPAGPSLVFQGTISFNFNP